MAAAVTRTALPSRDLSTTSNAACSCRTVAAASSSTSRSCIQKLQTTFLQGHQALRAAKHLQQSARQQHLLQQHQILRAIAFEEAPVVLPPSPALPAHSRELEAACTAVRLASLLCQRVQLQLRDGEHTQKQDSSPVTLADYGAQALITWSLCRSLPNTPLSLIAEEDADELRLSEGANMRALVLENVNQTLLEVGAQLLTEDELMDLIDIGHSRGGPQGRHWVLDPIDGTKGFVAMRQYAICLGLIEDADVAVGVLGCPNLPQAQISVKDGASGAATRSTEEDVGCLFAGVRRQGSWVGPLQGDDLPSQKLKVFDSADFSQLRYMQAFERRHSNGGTASMVATRLGITLPSLRMDSQVKYGALARGDASIFMAFRPPTYKEKIWDHAAGALIVEEAGGVVTDITGEPLDWGSGRTLDIKGGLVASTPSVHAAIVDAIQHVQREQQRPDAYSI